LKKGAKSFKIIGKEMTMKKYLLAFLIIMLGSGFLFPDSEVKLDVKTRFKEKFELKGVKWGVIYFLKKNGYNVVEVGEDYAVWLVDFEEERKDPDQYTLKLTVNISPPSLFRQKKTIASADVEVKYTFDPKELNVDDTGFPGFIKEKVENIKKKEQVRAFFVGHAVANKVKELLDRTGDRKQRAEAE
jgi:hypothetical protein